VDWNNDNDFGDANEDCTANLITVETRSGRDYASQLTGRATAGRLVANLRNPSGIYSSYVTANVLPGRKVQLTTTSPGAYTLWTGYLTRVIPSGSYGGIPIVTFEASGPISRVSEKNITPAVQTGVETGAIIEAQLTQAGWTVGVGDIDAGQTTVDNYNEGKIKTLNAVRDIEETELGFFYESADGKLLYEDRHHRLKGAHLVSQQTFSDAADPSYQFIEQIDPLQEIFNEILAAIQSYTIAGGSAVLWTLNETPTVGAGQTVIYWAEYPNVATDPNTGAYVSAWDTPAIGGDITQTGVANGDITISVSKFSKTMKISITNNHASATATLTQVQAQGVKVTKNEPVTISAEDATSQGKYGIRSYQLPAKWLQNTSVGLDYINYLISRYKDPVPMLSMTFLANKSDAAMTEALTRAISDRITVVATGATTELGIDDDFFIESISHKITEAGCRHEVTFELSAADADGGWWVLGTSALDSTARLAY
jgi:hypothetical protein